MLVDNRPFGRLEGTRLDGGAASQAKMRLRCLVGTERLAPVNHGRATLKEPYTLRTDCREQSKKCGILDGTILGELLHHGGRRLAIHVFTDRSKVKTWMPTPGLRRGMLRRHDDGAATGSSLLAAVGTTSIKSRCANRALS
jgi:hypothetical protein